MTKQVILRLDEQTYERFKNYVESRGTSFQHVLKQAVIKMLEERVVLTSHMEKVLRCLFETELNRLTDALYEAFKKSLILIPTKPYVVQVLIDEFGEIKILENTPGTILSSVTDAKAYLLYEFPSKDIFQFEILQLDQSKILVPFEKPIPGHERLSIDDFGRWLHRHTECKHWNDEWSFEDNVREEKYRYDIGEFVKLIYDWNPFALKTYRSYLLDILELTEYSEESYSSVRVYPDGTNEIYIPDVYKNAIFYECAKAINEILSRKELHFIDIEIKDKFLLRKSTVIRENSLEELLTTLKSVEAAG